MTVVRLTKKGVETERGRVAALAALAERRATYASHVIPRNEDLPAGSPMYFRCIGCGAPIVVPEGYLTKPDTCIECGALVALGWME